MNMNKYYEMEGYKIENSEGSYNFFNSDEEKILDCDMYNSGYDKQLVRNLQLEQYNELIDKYGSMRSIVMEQADTDGALNTVKLKYTKARTMIKHISFKPI